MTNICGGVLEMLEPIILKEQQKYFQIKINAGQNIFRSGGVLKLSDLKYCVSSATTDDVYDIFFDGERFVCNCMDFSKNKKYSYFKCKHIYGVLESMGLIQ